MNYEDSGLLVVLELHAAVRKRPGMYLGSTGPVGLLELAYGLLREALTRYRSRGVRRVTVTTGHGLVVTDDGSPPDLGEIERWNLWNYPPVGDPDAYVSRAYLGYMVIFALSSAAVATFDGDRRRQQLWMQGVAVTPLTDIGPAPGRGTTMSITPDTAIFGSAELPVGLLRRRLQDLAILHPTVTFELDGVALASHGGIPGYALFLAGELSNRHATRSENLDGVAIEVALAWAIDDAPPIERAWANGVEVEGEHLDGLWDGVAGTERGGRVAVLSVVVPFAEYEGPTQQRLHRPGLRELVAGVVRRALQEAAPSTP